jgi:hypothetical protein
VSHESRIVIGEKFDPILFWDGFYVYPLDSFPEEPY